MFALTVVFLGNMEFQIVKREVKDGTYSIAVYWLVNLIIHVPMMFVVGLCVIFPAFYPMMDLAWGGFVQNWLINSVTLLAMDSLAQVYAVDDNPLIGMMNQMNVWFMSFTFAGVWLVVDDIIWPFRAFAYILPFRWVFPTVGYAMLHHTAPYEGAYQCDISTRLAVAGPFNGTAVPCSPLTPDAEGFGFYCGPEVPPQSCVGRTGDQILDSFGVTFATIQSTDPDAGDQFWLAFTGLVTAMAIFCKVVHFARISIVCSQSAPVLPLTDAAADKESIEVSATSNV